MLLIIFSSCQTPFIWYVRINSPVDDHALTKSCKYMFIWCSLMLTVNLFTMKARVLNIWGGDDSLCTVCFISLRQLGKVVVIVINNSKVVH